MSLHPRALRTLVFVAALLASLLSIEAAAQDRHASNYDAFAQEARGLEPLPPSPALQRLLDAGVDVPLEAALGVPTVYRVSSGEVPPVPASVKRPEDAGRWALEKLAPLYGLSPSTVQRLDAVVMHDTGFGGIIVRFTQSINGVEVHRHRLNVLLDRSTWAPVALTGYVYRGYEAVAPANDPRFAFAVAQEIAIQQAIFDRHGEALDPALIKATGRQQAAWSWYTLDASAIAQVGPDASFEPIRVKPVFFGLVGRLEPAWHLELISSGFDAPRQTWSYVISARDGRLLERTSLDFNHTYRVWTDAEGWPLDSPLGTGLTPRPPGTDNSALDISVPPVLIDVPMGLNAPGDPWLADDATETNGNNVDAYADLNLPDGLSPGDLRGAISAPGIFDYAYDTTLAPLANPNQTQASIEHLFYVNNFLHDLFYDHGFDELAGNAQVDNYGRGGLGDDAIRAEAQDSSGLNNANMSTPADGAQPRMQMYLWSHSTATLSFSGVQVTDGVNGASFGARNADVTAEVVSGLDGVGAPGDLCEPPNNNVAGRFVLADRGNCTFTQKALNAQSAGAIGLIIVNNGPGAPPTPGPAAGADMVTIPVVAITLDAGTAVRAALAQMPVSAALSIRSFNPDGSLDNNVVTHEWGHYLFARLVTLGSNQTGGLNEGNSDVVAQILAVRPEDVMAPGNDQWQGAWPQGTYAQSNAINGIRRAPYSTDFAINGLTFAHIDDANPLPPSVLPNGVPNSEVHNTGEVWAVMMWEVYAALLQQHPFDVARSRMLDCLVASLKLAPNSPTFVELRDATLLAILASDVDDYVLAWEAFARRGLGTGAVAPPRDNANNTGVVESFILAPDIALTGLELVDDLQGCDGDGILDVGELGGLHLQLQNTSPLPLANLTATATSTNPNLTFPDGPDVPLPDLAIGESIVFDLPVFVSEGANQAESIDVTVEVTSPDLVDPIVRTIALRSRVQVDEVLGSRSDDVEPIQTAWTVSYDDQTPGFAQPYPFQRYEYQPDDFMWVVPGFGSGRSDQVLTSPPLQVSATGGFIFSFTTAWSFESDVAAGIHYDAGVLEITNDDGQTWVDVNDIVPIGYNGVVTDLGVDNANPLANRMAWVDTNPSFPDLDRIQVDLGARFQGQTVQIRFRAGTDPAAFGLGWAIDDIVFENIDNAPFYTFAPNRGLCLDAPPIANAGPDQTVFEGERATLDGSGSVDPWDRDLLWTWRQIDGPTVTLDGADTPTPSFLAPDVMRDTTLTFGLTVATIDGRVGPVEDVIAIHVRYINQPPVADAGDDAQRDEGQTHTLDGTRSSDVDGDTLRYLWTQLDGPAVRLDDPNAARPTFVAPEVITDSTVRFQLVVTDGLAPSQPDTVDVLVRQVNRAPVADAGADLTVHVLEPVVLDGSASADPDGDALSYAWTQTDGPTVTLDDPTAAQPGFEAPSVHDDTTLTFELVVSDGALSSAAATVDVTILGTNARPIADAGLDDEVDEGAEVTLDGSASADADADPLIFTWSQLSGPGVLLSDPNAASPSFTAPQVAEDTTLTFQLLVSDGSALSDPDTVSVGVRQVNQAPTADAGEDQTVASEADARLDGIESSDPDGDELSYAWTQTDGPAVTLDDASAARPRFTAPAVDEDTTLTFELVVDDGTVTSDADSVAITVLAPNEPPTADAGANQTVDEGAAFQLDGSASADPDGDELTFVWTQTSGPAATISGANTASPSVTAPLVASSATLQFQLLVSDGRALSEPATVQVEVQNVNAAPTANAGANRTVSEFATIVLDGSASADPDGDALSYTWTQTAGPEVTLSGATSVTPSFEVPSVSQPTTLTFQLVVNDGALDSTPDTVDILIDNISVRSVDGGGCSCASPGRPEPRGSLWWGLSALTALGALTWLRRR